MAENSVQVLLVEDDEGHARLVERNLKRGGFPNRVFRVRDGQEALDYLYFEGEFANREWGGPLVIVLDIKMPRVDGLEVLRQIKSTPTTSKVPVIILTTTDNPDEIEQSYSLGCNVYISKPVDYEAFVEVVHRLGHFLQVVKILPEHRIRERER
jgi:CheY-like chemotaxis protein